MRRLQILLILFTVQISTSVAQTTINLPNRETSIQRLIPDGWELLSSTEGDINRDGVMDIAFVIEKSDSATTQSPGKLTVENVERRPRILAVYVGNGNTSDYKKVLQSNHFILQRTSPNMAEPFSELSINDAGKLEIVFSIWFTAGSWSRTNYIYGFKFCNNEFLLTNYQRTEVHRARGSVDITDINFQDKEIEIEKGHISSDEPISVERKTFSLEKLQTLKSLQSPLEWEFLGMKI